MEIIRVDVNLATLSFWGYHPQIKAMVYVPVGLLCVIFANVGCCIFWNKILSVRLNKCSESYEETGSLS